MSSKEALNIIKVFFLKFRFGKQLKLISNIPFLRTDTEIAIGKDAILSLGTVCVNTNVHLLCDCGEMYIGNDVGMNRNCIVACRHRIKIGDKCLFGPNVCIYDHDHVYDVDGLIDNEFKCSEIIIEDGCWIGAGAIILRGTHIGKNSVIGAGAVVKGNIPSNSLVTTMRENRIIPTALYTGKHN